MLVSHLIAKPQYGAASSLLALAALLAIPLTSIQPAVTRQVAVAEPGAIRLVRPIIVATMGGLVLVAVARLLVTPLDNLLHLRGAWAVVLFAAYVAAILVEGIPRGALVGGRRYAGVALLVGLGAVVRLGVAGGWSAITPGEIGPLAGAAIGELLTAGLLLVALRKWNTKGPRDRRLRMEDVWLSSAGFTGLLSIMSIDTIAARHWLGGSASGLYAAASIAGSIAYFMPAAAAVAIFPDVARAAESRDSRSFWVGMGEVSLLALGTAGVLAIAAPLVIRVMFPAGYAGARAPLEILSISYGLLGVLGFLVNHHLAHHSRTIYLPWLGAAVLTSAVFLEHRTPTAIALDALVASALMFIVMSAASLRLEHSSSAAGDAL